MSRPFLLLVLLGGAACATAPAGTPGEVAEEIVDALDHDRPDDAGERFDRAVREQAFAEKLYPILYEEAGRRYGDQDAEAAARILRFMLSRYPTATAVPEALLYCLFLETAGQDEPSHVLNEEIDSVLKELRSRGRSPSVWVDLIETQRAIDRRSLPEARAAYDRFLRGWDGRPAELAFYVEDIERYLTSH